MSNNGEEISELYNIALTFFKEMEFEIEEKVTLVGASGKKHHFDMIIKTNSDVEISEVLVKIVDWNRAVGVDRLIRFERMLNDLSNRKGMIVSNIFSESAIKFAKRRGLIIYERDHLHFFRNQKLKEMI
ncbi:MAG: restriction endonuclease [Asgard group archaeon]|nr:restriction endonuclease [Asgard group archaeon]